MYIEPGQRIFIGIKKCELLKNRVLQEYCYLEFVTYPLRIIPQNESKEEKSFIMKSIESNL